MRADLKNNEKISLYNLINYDIISFANEYTTRAFYHNFINKELLTLGFSLRNLIHVSQTTRDIYKNKLKYESYEKSLRSRLKFIYKLRNNIVFMALDYKLTVYKSIMTNLRKLNNVLNKQFSIIKKGFVQAKYVSNK